MSINSKKEIPSHVVPTKAEEIGIDKFTFEGLKEKISSTFGDTADLQSDVIQVGKSEGCIYYLETVVNTEMLKEMLGNTLENAVDKDIAIETIEDLHNLSKRSFGVSGYKLLKTVNHIVSSLLEGRIVIVFRGVGEALSLNYLNSEGRAVAEPTTQTVVRGPKDSFVEDATTNINLIRKRIRNHHLRFEKFMLGNETRTNVYMGYMYSIANEKIVEEVRSRLNKIDISAVFESANVEELIVDKSMTVFPLAMNTERPDAVATYLMDAKIVIIIDGSPFVLIVPAVLTDFLLPQRITIKTIL